jgi:hypothetical protein
VKPTQPLDSARPNASGKPDTAVDAVSEKDRETPAADVGSDRMAQGNPGKKPPLDIEEIEDLEGDVEGG